MKRWVQFICAILAVVLVCLTGTVSYLLTHSATVKAAGPYVFYLDYANGNDATTATPLGWWSVAYTNGNGTTPVANETAQGGTSGSSAKLTIAPTVSGGSWGAGTAAGTLYWYGKSAPFVAETLTFAVGGATCSIGGDFTYCAWKTITSGATAARIAPGDVIRVAKSPDPVFVDNATWTQASTTITLDSAQNLDVNMCEAAWTPVTGIVATVAAAPTAGGSGYTAGDILTITTGGSGGTVRVEVVDGLGAVTSVSRQTGGRSYTTGAAKATIGGTGDGNCTVNITAVVNATTATNTDKQEGANSVAVVAPATSVTNSCYAYRDIADTDYSSYQSLTFWFKNEVACAATWWRINLCSDDAGETPVDTISIPATPSAGTWVPLTIARAGGGNLANPVRSIALWTGAVAPTASKYVRLDDFTTATTGGLNLQSLVSKSDDAQCEDNGEAFYPLWSISGPTLVYFSYSGGYSGATETVPTYKRETTQTALAALAGTAVQKVQDSGTAAASIFYQGGWDSALGHRNGETYFDGLTMWGYGIVNNYEKYVSFEHLSMVRYYSGYFFDQVNASYMTVVEADEFAACSSIGFQCSNQNTYNTLTRVYNVVSSNTGISAYASYTTVARVDNISNCAIGLSVQSGNAVGCVVGDVGNVQRCGTGVTIAQGSCHVNSIGTIEYCSTGLHFNTAAYLNAQVDYVGKVSHNTAYGIFFSWASGVHIDYVGECSYNATGVGYTQASKNVISYIGNLDYNTNYGLDFSISSQAARNMQNVVGLIGTANNNGLGINFYWFGNGQYNQMNNYIGEVTECNNSTTYAVRFSGYVSNNVIGTISTSGSGTAPVRIEGPYANNYILHATMAEAIKTSTSVNYALGQVYIGYSDGNWGVYGYGATAITQTTTIYGASGVAVRVNPFNSDRVEYYSFAFPIGVVHCVSGVNQSVSARVKKDHATNVGCRIYCLGGQVPGVVNSEATKALDTNWELLTLNLTPTADGDVLILFDSWYVAGASYAYVDLTPTVTTLGSSDVEEESAVLSAVLAYPVQPYTQGFAVSVPSVGLSARGFEYDIDSGAPYANDWHEHGTNLTGTYSSGTSGLEEGTLYYYQGYSTDAWATYYTSEGTFLTKPDAPVDLVATPTTAILYTLDWTKGDGAQNTVIRGKVGSFPTSPTDGDLVYNGVGVSCSHAVAGEHWYYRAWSYATDGGLEQWSDSTAMDSCEYCGGGGPANPPDAPTNFTATYNSDNLSVYLTWVLGVDADNTLIQASVDGYPTSPTEGATVYFGPSDNCTDSLDWAMIEDGGTVYYSAWGSNPGGLSVDYATADTGGGVGMTNALIVIPVILLLGGLSIIGDTKRMWLLILVAGFGWFLFAGWCMTTSAQTWDIYFILAILGAMIALVTFIWPLVTRPQELPPEEEITESEKAWGGKGKRPQRPKRWQGQ